METPSQRRVSRDVPLSEITLRRFEKPYGDREEILRKFCISIGLLQPADSRDLLVSILSELIKARERKVYLSTEEIQDKTNGSKPNIRRHLRRMVSIGLVEKLENKYRIREFMKISDVMTEHIKPFVIEPAFSRILEYSEALDSL
jgi:DNA-binding transcriptional ArsR family regulator